MSLGVHPLATQFLRRLRRSLPSRKLLLPSWDLLVVLRACCLALFEPVSSADLQLVCWETAFQPSGWVHPSAEAKRLHNLGPVRPLRFYVGRKSFCTSDKPFVVYRGTTLGKPISKQRLAHWLMCMWELISLQGLWHTLQREWPLHGRCFGLPP